MAAASTVTKKEKKDTPLKSNLKTVHSITARSFNKQRLAELREKAGSSDVAALSTMDAPLQDTELQYSPDTEQITKQGSPAKKYRAPEHPKGAVVTGERVPSAVQSAPSIVASSASAMEAAPVSAGKTVTQSTTGQASQNPGRKLNPVLNRVAFWNKRLENEIVSDECVADEIQNLLPEYS